MTEMSQTDNCKWLLRPFSFRYKRLHVPCDGVEQRRGLPLRRALGEAVALELGLGARGAQEDLGAARQAPLEHVGGREDLGGVARQGVHHRHRGAVGVVERALHGQPADRGRGLGAQARRERRHGRRAARPLEDAGDLPPGHVPAAARQVPQRVDQVHAPGLVVGRHLAGERERLHAVLVAHVDPLEVAAALLQAEQEAAGLTRGLQQARLLAGELEAGEGAPELHAPVPGDVVGPGGRDHRGHAHPAGEVLPARRGPRAEPVHEQLAQLVAGEQPVGAPVPHGHAHAVGVRVGGQRQVAALPPGEVSHHPHGLGELGVGVRTGGEPAVGLGLLGNREHLPHPHAGEERGRVGAARAVERGVGHAQAGHVHALELGGHRVEVARPQAGAGLRDESRGPGLRDRRARRPAEGVDGVDGRLDLPRRLRGDLAPVGAVDLVAVVLGGVVRGGDAHASRAAQVPHREGELRGGGHPVEEVGAHAVGGEHLGGALGELRPSPAAVAGDHHGGIPAPRVQPVGQALGGLAHRPDVEAVRAEADLAAQAARAEAQVAREGVLQGGGVLPSLGKKPPAFYVEIGFPLAQELIINHSQPLYYFESMRLTRPNNL